jgi:hypothetical protein
MHIGAFSIGQYLPWRHEWFCAASDYNLDNVKLYQIEEISEPSLQINSVNTTDDKKIKIDFTLTPHDPAPAGGYDISVLALKTVQSCTETANIPDNQFDDITAYVTGNLHIVREGGPGSLLWDLKSMPPALRNKYYIANLSVQFRLKADPVD